jgi:hypothetical protein
MYCTVDSRLHVDLLHVSGELAWHGMDGWRKSDDDDEYRTSWSRGNQYFRVKSRPHHTTTQPLSNCNDTDRWPHPPVVDAVESIIMEDDKKAAHVKVRRSVGTIASVGCWYMVSFASAASLSACFSRVGPELGPVDMCHVSCHRPPFSFAAVVATILPLRRLLWRGSGGGFGRALGAQRCAVDRKRSGDPVRRQLRA